MNVYTIKEGKHRSGLHFLPHFGSTRMHVQAMLSRHCWFEKRDYNDDDLNKLAGFSFGFHHRNSLRIGWVPDFKNENVFKLFAYWYNQGSFRMEFLTVVRGGQVFDIRLDAKNQHVIVAGVAKTIPFELPRFRWGYHLYPYFGGDNRAPHDLRIMLSDLL